MSKPTGIITLTTDFGYEGPYVGVMKGVILSRLADARIIDISHAIHAHCPSEAGFWLARSWHYFPVGSVHVAVVDPGVGTDRSILVAQSNGHTFIAPDNGLLQPVLKGSNSTALIFRLSETWLKAEDWPTSSSTFHGRDIFAPLAAAIAGNRVRPKDVGPATTSIASCEIGAASLEGNEASGVIIAIDRFGNLITNIDRALLNAFRIPVAHAAGRSFRFHSTYGNCEPGAYIALINSFGVVEISCAESNAAEGLGLCRGEPVTITDAA